MKLKCYYSTYWSKILLTSELKNLHFPASPPALRAASINFCMLSIKDGGKPSGKATEGLLLFSLSLPMELSSVILLELLLDNEVRNSFTLFFSSFITGVWFSLWLDRVLAGLLCWLLVSDVASFDKFFPHQGWFVFSVSVISSPSRHLKNKRRYKLFTDITTPKFFPLMILYLNTSCWKMMSGLYYFGCTDVLKNHPLHIIKTHLCILISHNTPVQSHLFGAFFFLWTWEMSFAIFQFFFFIFFIFLLKIYTQVTIIFPGNHLQHFCDWVRKIKDILIIAMNQIYYR